ncbi:MAG: hypothetical protein J0H62_12200, partial [Rhizobiales bacterium]|nr:hypothetical protein [Hyphomicrobiales bacterium]
RIRRALPLLTTMAGPALVVSAMPLVMTALLAIGSNRPEISYEAAGLGSLHPADLMMLVFGNLFGASVKDAVFWGPPSFPWKQAMGPGDLFVAQNMGQIYSGIFAPLALALFAPARGSGLWGRELRFFVVGLALMLLYALGWYTPAFRAIYELVPGVALFRRPADATFLIGYLVAVITGYLVHRWLVGAVPPLAWRDRIVAGLAAAAVIGCALWLAVSVGYLRQALTPIAIGLVMVLLALVALYAARRVATRAPAMAAAVLALVAVGDLAISNGPNGSTALPPATYAAMRPDTANETIRLIKGRLAATAAPDRRDRVELIAIAYHWPNISLSHGFDHLFGQNPLRLRDFFAATGVGDTVAVPDQRTFAPLYPSYHSVFADLFGVRFIATGVPVEAIDRNLRPGDLPLIARTKDAFVYENPHALPRAMFVGGARVADFSRMLREG